MRNMYDEKELVRIAKRENNNRRAYLVVNPWQGKHVPAPPGRAVEMFGELGKKVESAYPGQRLLLIGFAETATAVGAAIACRINALYIQTTREQIPGVDYLYFSEEHSHATEQKIVREDFEKIADSVQRIVFVEDEITTGNTIMNIITLLRKTFHCRASFSAASLLNGMDQAHEEIYRENGIDLLYLLKTSHESYGYLAGRARGDGPCIVTESESSQEAWRELECSGYLNARRLVNGNEYQSACDHLWRQMWDQVDFGPGERILVLGTEEFMYPALYAACKIEEMGKQVRFHATTRSPIVVSGEPEYPLHKRYSLSSLYDSERTTYLYDLEKYDRVFVITDAKDENRTGMKCITHALIQCENTDITYIRWKDEGNS